MLDLKKLLQFKVNYLSNSDRSDIDISTKEGRSTYLKREENLIELEKEAETLFYEIPNLEFELFNIFQSIKEKAYQNALEKHKSHLNKIKSNVTKKYINRMIEEYEIESLKSRASIKPYFDFFEKACKEYEIKNRREFDSLVNNGTNLYLLHAHTCTEKIIKICDFRSEIERYLIIDNHCKIINMESENSEKINLIREDKKLNANLRKPKPSLKFEEIFVESTLHYIINLLLSNNIIKKNNEVRGYCFENELNVNSHLTSTSKVCINKTFITVLARKLFEENYFIKGITARQILNSFETFFNVEHLKAQVYSDVKNNRYKYELYFNLLNFIPAKK